MANTFRIKNGLDVTGNTTTTGTVDGRNLATDGTKLDGIEALADVTDAINVNAAGAVMEIDYNANTILSANADDTPLPLTIGASTIFGRKATGNAVALTAAETRTIINVEDGATADQTAADIRTLGFFDTTNDGTGSGLDADLLDGNEATAFATSTQGTTADNALPKAGGTMSGAIAMGTNKITGLSDPTVDQDAATKKYVDTFAAGLDAKGSVRVATTANGALATAYENGDLIDGVTLSTGDRILLKDQTTGSENGIYTVNASGAPTRATDADTDAEVTAGMYCFVEEGTANADTAWILTTDNPITVGTTALTFAKFSNVTDLITSVFGRTGAVTAATSDYDAVQVDNTPAGNIVATNVQAAIDELDTEKAALAGAAFTGAITTTSTFDGRDVATDGTKLDGIETSADVTDATNVNAAGAVMESDYNVNTILSANADNTPLPLTIGASTIFGRKATGDAVALTAAETRTIINVEDGATADQSNAEIKTAYEANANTNEFSDAEQTKLAGIATGAIANVVEDTTPQLGGNLDVNGNSIVSVSNANITIDPDGTGELVLGDVTYSKRVLVALADNQASAATIFSYAKTEEAGFVRVKLDRGAGNRYVGELFITTDGTSVSITDTGTELGTIGVDFSAVVNGANIDVKYTSTSTGTAPNIEYVKMTF